MFEKLKTKEVLENVGDSVGSVAEKIASNAKLGAFALAMGVVTLETAGVAPPKTEFTKAVHDRKNIVMPVKSEIAFNIGPINLDGSSNEKENVRRVEDTGPHRVSYGIGQRTPARSGGI